jgi:alkylhydroperoxidase family enzyme
VFALSRFLMGRPGCQRFRIVVLALLMFLAPAVTPPPAARMASSGPRGSTPSRSASLDSARLSSDPRILENAEAWKHLPAAEKGYGGALPVWARTLAKTLPHTTAAMLELDYLHRERNGLEPRLRGQLRWVAAHANRCRYSEAFAAADLRRAGMDEADIQNLAGDLTTLPALQFARNLSRDGGSVTDDEMARLLAQYGERQVVAMTMLVAFASFQDRIILALGLPQEPDGPLPPLEARFARLSLGASRAAPPRQKPQRIPPTMRDKAAVELTTSPLRAKGIEEKLAEQRTRRCRIALPSDNAEAPRWGLVCRVYQAELADAWAACAHAFGDEANQDPLFEHSLFWLVTHDIGCFY